MPCDPQPARNTPASDGRGGLAGPSAVSRLGGLAFALLVSAIGHCSAFGGRCPADPEPLMQNDVFGSVAATIAIAVWVVALCRPGRSSTPASAPTRGPACSGSTSCSTRSRWSPSPPTGSRSGWGFRPDRVSSSLPRAGRTAAPACADPAAPSCRRQSALAMTTSVDVSLRAAGLDHTVPLAPDRDGHASPVRRSGAGR
jgi:hypothetical protein